MHVLFQNMLTEICCNFSICSFLVNFSVCLMTVLKKSRLHYMLIHVRSLFHLGKAVLLPSAKLSTLFSNCAIKTLQQWGTCYLDLPKTSDVQQYWASEDDETRNSNSNGNKVIRVDFQSLEEWHHVESVFVSLTPQGFLQNDHSLLPHVFPLNPCFWWVLTADICVSWAFILSWTRCCYFFGTFLMWTD